MEYSYSQTFFELSDDFYPRRRMQCVKDFFKKVVILPFALFFKVYKTFFRVAGVCLSGGLMLVTLGVSVSVREWFVLRMGELGKDLTDWFIWPFSIAAYLTRLLIAFFRI